MAIAITPQERRTYVLVRERQLPAAQQTTYFFRALPYTLRVEFGIRFAGMERSDPGRVSGDAREIAEMVTRAVRFMLVGAEGLRDDAGATVPFEHELDTSLGGQPLQVPTWAFLERIPPNDRDELGTEALRVQRLGPADVRG
jgi:hypothetical protein